MTECHFLVSHNVPFSKLHNYKIFHTTEIFIVMLVVLVVVVVVVVVVGVAENDFPTVPEELES